MSQQKNEILSNIGSTIAPLSSNITLFDTTISYIGNDPNNRNEGINDLIGLWEKMIPSAEHLQETIDECPKELRKEITNQVVSRLARGDLSKFETLTYIVESWRTAALEVIGEPKKNESQIVTGARKRFGEANTVLGLSPIKVKPVKQTLHRMRLNLQLQS